MGGAFWILFIIQVAILVYCCRLIFKVEKEKPMETIVPATDKDIEVY